MKYKIKYNLFGGSPPFPIDIIIPWSGSNDNTSKKYQSRANRDEGILKYELLFSKHCLLKSINCLTLSMFSKNLKY